MTLKFVSGSMVVRTQQEVAEVRSRISASIGGWGTPRSDHAPRGCDSAPIIGSVRLFSLLLFFLFCLGNFFEKVRCCDSPKIGWEFSGCTGGFEICSKVHAVLQTQ